MSCCDQFDADMLVYGEHFHGPDGRIDPRSVVVQFSQLSQSPVSRESIKAVAESVGVDPLDLAVAMVEDADRELCEMPGCRYPAEYETVLMKLCSDHGGPHKVNKAAGVEPCWACEGRGSSVHTHGANCQFWRRV